MIETAIPSALSQMWSLAIEKDDAYCQGRATWEEARDAWSVAYDAADEAGDHYSEMKSVSKNAYQFYDAQRDKAPRVEIYSRHRTPWRSRR